MKQSSDKNESISLTHFKDIDALKNYLENPSVKKNPLIFNSKDLLLLILQWIKTDNSLSLFSDCLDCLNALKKFEKFPTNTYKTYEADLNQVLKAYQFKLEKMIKDESFDNMNNLSQFFTIFHHSSKINFSKQAPQGSLNPFSTQSTLENNLEAIEKIFQRFTKLNSRSASERSQRAYSQLLGDILNGEQDVNSLLPLMKQQFDKQTVEQRSLLPETEFEVPSAEPEHPNYIGFNETMNFNPEEIKAITELFTTEDLKSNFSESFPWSITVENSEMLEEAQAIPDINLIGTSDTFESKVQLAVIKFALLSLDTLSKLAGYEGQSTISNFNRIKEISDVLQNISDSLMKLNPTDTASFLLRLKAYTAKLRAENKLYYKSRHQVDGLQIQTNPKMNDFCHLNEILVYTLTDFELVSSVLTPKFPRAKIAEKINKALYAKKMSEDFAIINDLDIDGFANIPLIEDVTETKPSPPKPVKAKKNKKQPSIAKEVENTMLEKNTIKPSKVKKKNGLKKGFKKSSSKNRGGSFSS